MTRPASNRWHPCPRVLIGAALVAGALAGHGAPAGAQSADVLLECSACHVTEQSRIGGPTTDPPYPDLSGQPARYLDRQLDAYREGLRIHRQMQRSAVALGAGGAPAMARRYADAAIGRLEEPAADAVNEAGRRLALEGAWERGVPPCAQCHTLEPDQAGRLSPRLHGLDAAYLAHELRAYADGQRQSDTMGRMRAFAAQLSQAEIEAVADYYAAFKPARSGQ